MNDVFFARSQMGMSLAFHILAVIVIFLLRRQFMETQPRWIKKEPVLQETPTTPKISGL